MVTVIYITSLSSSIAFKRVLAPVHSTIAQNPQTSKACLVFELLNEHGK